MSESSPKVSARPPMAGGVVTRSTRPGAGRPDPLRDVVIVTAEPGNSLPSILVTGDSGTGKTHQIGRVMRAVRAAGKSSLLLGIENKWQALGKYRPMVTLLTKTVVADGVERKPNAMEVYDRMMAVIDKIGVGGYREHEGKEVVLVAIDGLIEVADIVARKMKMDRPTAKSTGERDGYAMWDAIGEKTVDIMKAFRDAGSEATRARGAAPLSVIATCGLSSESDKFGVSMWRPMLQGKIAPKALPFQFEAVIRLSIEDPGDGSDLYVANLSSGTDVNGVPWKAKCPAIGLPRRIAGAEGTPDAPDMGVIYRKLIAHYQDTTIDVGPVDGDGYTPSGGDPQQTTGAGSSSTEGGSW